MLNHIIISNQKNLDSKLSQLQKDGLKSISVISDFDRTLTYAANRNSQNDNTSFGLMKSTEGFPDSAVQQLEKYFSKYRPQEDNPDLDNQTKIKLMIEWWSKAFDVYVQQSIKKQLIHQVVEKYGLSLRSGCIELLAELKTKQIPLLIFSAGMGEVIDHYLNHQQLNSDNIGLISNFFTYNNADEVIGYQQPIIHSLNKTEDTVGNKSHYSQAVSRKNIILLGDSLYDPHMAKDSNHDCVLRIGFLNHKEEQLLDKYQQLYDVVLLKDQGLEYVLKIIEGMV